MLGQTALLHSKHAVLDPFAHHRGSRSYSPGIGEVGGIASLGRWKHVAGRGGVAEVNALGVERRTTVAFPVTWYDVGVAPPGMIVLNLRKRLWFRRTVMLKDTVAL